MVKKYTQINYFYTKKVLCFISIFHKQSEVPAYV